MNTVGYLKYTDSLFGVEVIPNAKVVNGSIFMTERMFYDVVRLVSDCSKMFVETAMIHSAIEQVTYKRRQ